MSTLLVLCDDPLVPSLVASLGYWQAYSLCVNAIVAKLELTWS